MRNKPPRYIQGAKFIDETREPHSWIYPRNPDKYTPSNKFRQRFRDLGGAVNGDDIRDAFKYGELYAAAQGCAAFVKDAGGVAFYLVVNAKYKGSPAEFKYNSWDVISWGEQIELLQNHYDKISSDDFYHNIVTLWPYVYNKEKALDTGRWSSKQLDDIEDIKADIDTNTNDN